MPSSKGRSKKPFVAALNQIDGEKVDLKSGEQTHADRGRPEGGQFVVAEVRKREVQRNPAAPFTTSTLQQEASRKLGFTAKRTMAVAQQLYEGVQVGSEGQVGLITYMRTDSTNIADVSPGGGARVHRREVRPGRTSRRSHGSTRRRARAPRRPTRRSGRPRVVREPETSSRPDLSADQYKLYRLIWQRFVASQMAAAVMDATSVDILGQPANADGAAPAATAVASGRYLFRASGSTVKFPGFIAVYVEGKDEGEEPEEEEDGESLAAGPRAGRDHSTWSGCCPEQHFTQPPPRYTEATLVKALEEYGIGRPSTYAPTLSTIQDRGYVERVGRQLSPTPIGVIVNDLLVAHFPVIVDVDFTATMEEKLDEIANQSAGVG